MKKTLKLMSVLMALAMMLSLTACGGSSEPKDELDAIKKAGVITVAISPDFAPMEFVDSSKEGQDSYVGFDVFLANYIAQELGVKLDIQAMSFDACQTAVSMGSVNMSLSGYSWTETRAENFELSDPYFARDEESDNESRQVILIKAEDAEKYKSAADFAGATVGAQNASLQMDLLTAQLPDAVPYPIGEIGVGVMELQAGNIDAMAVANGNADVILLSYDGLVKAAWEFDVSEESDGNVIMIHKGNAALLAAVNEILAKADSEGLYSGWYKQAKEMAGLPTAQEVSIED